MSDGPGVKELIPNQIYLIKNATYLPNVLLTFNKKSGEVFCEQGSADIEKKCWKMKFNRNSGTWALEGYLNSGRYLQRKGDEANTSGDALIKTTLQLSSDVDVDDPSCQWFIQSYPDYTFRIFAPRKSPGVAIELSDEDFKEVRLNVTTVASLWSFT